VEAPRPPVGHHGPRRGSAEAETCRAVEQASSLVTRELAVEHIPCGPDVKQHVAAVRRFLDAGFDEVYVQQIGPEQDQFFDAWSEAVLPELR
jgi:hypothetical protein